MRAWCITGESCSTHVQKLIAPLPWYDVKGAWKIYRKTVNECRQYYVQIQEKQNVKKHSDCMECGCDIADCDLPTSNKCDCDIGSCD